MCMSSTGKASTVLVAAVVFLLLTSFGEYFSFVRLQTSARWVRHTLDVQRELDHFSTAFTRAAGCVHNMSIRAIQRCYLVRLKSSLRCVMYSPPFGVSRQIT